MKRGPKGDPNPQKGPLGDPGTLKGTHCVTVGDPCGSSGQGVGRQEEGPYGPGGKERGPVLLHGPHKGAWGEKERSVKLFFNV